MRKLAVTATLAAVLAVGVPAPASAADPDCKIMGPEYVSEVVDCAIYLYTIAIGWPR